MVHRFMMRPAHRRGSMECRRDTRKSFDEGSSKEWTSKSSVADAPTNDLTRQCNCSAQGMQTAKQGCVHC